MIQLCPICQGDLIKGVIKSKEDSGVYWLPMPGTLEGWLLTKKKVLNARGCLLGKVSKLGFFSFEYPEVYVCPKCNMLYGDISSYEKNIQ